MSCGSHVNGKKTNTIERIFIKTNMHVIKQKNYHK